MRRDVPTRLRIMRLRAFSAKIIGPQLDKRAAVFHRAVLARLWLQPRGAIGHLVNRVVRRLRREYDVLHRAGLERRFLATEKGKTYRVHPRHQTICPGKFYIGDQVIDCVVFNISVGGAKIHLTEPVDATSQARLWIERIGEFSGRVAWRNGATLGIEFHDQLHDIERIVQDMLPSTKQKHLE